MFQSSRLPPSGIGVSPKFLYATREAYIIIMLATAGIAASRTRMGKLALFLLLFGIWDLFYYVWLKVFLNWPPSWLTWDVLFLTPVLWVGPVVAVGDFLRWAR